MPSCTRCPARCWHFMHEAGGRTLHIRQPVSFMWAVQSVWLQERTRWASRMLKKSASGVLASFRGSTYRSVRLASSLATALLDSHFEHPEVLGQQRHSVRFQRYFMYTLSVSASC